jgi:hypothetical protein
MAEEDLLSALTELFEASKAMTSGSLHTAAEMERYQLALSWAERLIRSSNSGLTNFCHN